MWTSQFQGLSQLNDATQKILDRDATIRDIKQGTVLFGPGTAPDQLLFLIDGLIRVQQVSPSGREIVLFRVNAGESCVLTTACLLAYEDYLAEGIAETDITVAAVPRATFEDLLSTSSEFRHFVFTAYSRRVTELFQLIQEVTFTKIDIRLAQKLLEFSKDNEISNVTHQGLATELGSVREVISRQLQEFQRRSWIKLSRGHIVIEDRPALQQLAAET